MAVVKLRFVGIYYTREVTVPDEEFTGRGPTVQRVMDLCAEQDSNFFTDRAQTLLLEQ